MADSISDAGYALIALGMLVLLATNCLLAGWPHRLFRSQQRPGQMGFSEAAIGKPPRPGNAGLPWHHRPVEFFSILNIIAAALVAIGNVAVYRVVLAEQLLGVVLTSPLGHGPLAVVTTIIIFVALLQLLCENIALLGSGWPPNRPRAFAARGLTSLFFILAILLGKLALGIVYYDPLPLCVRAANASGWAQLDAS